LEFTVETNGGGWPTGGREINWVKLRRPTFIFPETRACPQLEPERILAAHGRRGAVDRETINGRRSQTTASLQAVMQSIDYLLGYSASAV
jgi:hypothetical protein